MGYSSPFGDLLSTKEKIKWNYQQKYYSKWEVTKFILNDEKHKKAGEETKDVHEIEEWVLWSECPQISCVGT